MVTENKDKLKFWRGIRTPNDEKATRTDKENYATAMSFFRSSLGRRIVTAKEKTTNNNVFQVCVRDRYFNVYWNGCSVLRYSPNARMSRKFEGATNKYRIHYRYIDENLLDKCAGLSKDPYLPLVEVPGDLRCSLKEDWSFVENIIEQAESGDISEVKEYLHNTEDKEKYGEKVLLNKFLNSNRPQWIDLEVAFTRKREPFEIKTGSSRTYISDRIDLARIAVVDGTPVLQLVEVKIADDPRLRSREEIPEILAQMKRYREFITRHIVGKSEGRCGDLLASYQTVASNLLDFGLVDGMSWGESEGIREILQRFVEEGEVAKDPSACYWRHRKHEGKGRQRMPLRKVGEPF